MNRENREKIVQVRQFCNKQELLAQLAEECAELSHAALKMRRVLSGVNPTPMQYEEARDNLTEEIADVMLSMEALSYNPLKVNQIMQDKLDRWLRRLQEKDRGDDL